MKTARGLFGSIFPRLGRLTVIISLAAAAAVPIGGAAQGSRQSQDAQNEASGTISVTDRMIVMSYRQGNDVVQERLVHRRLTGTFAGTEVSVAHYVIHADASATVSAVISCTCTVAGRAGTVTFRDRGTLSAVGVLSLHRESIDATGGLAGLRATLEITGSITAPDQTYTGLYYFSGEDD
jgi:hypothetical protein